ncbi:GDSL-type esterase/lipase family protein [Paenibacillus soyae]|uniref:GDSL-type esterase/lipase family protein n=1 Tax=Paenibacillus soyae TaxID=2969249 RepID=A0A9X2S9P2_9BACL|nr:GDSL-type esterase/lipase family protein [Paenibacillus soyae]MCR2802942.1 GDSL-type esterase/lipase family protein [Paenibacillus soyae]
MNSRLAWYLIAVCSVIATVLWLTGLGITAMDILVPASASEAGGTEETRTAPVATPLEQAEEIRLLALGDSLTKGTGDETGQGYVHRLAEGLKSRYGKPVSMLGNLAVNGMTATELSERLEQDEIVQNTVRQANLIVFSIGGNDLFLSARAKWNGRQLKAVSVDELTGDLEEAAGRFRSITSRLHALNPNATVVYMGLYNPFFDIDELRDASLKIQLWNKQAYGALHEFPLMRMAPTFDLFEDRIIERLSSDHFHPNGDGYEKIASRMLDAL